MGVHAYTIVSRAYVPHARVLARSFSEHHPDGQFWALLIDDVKREVNEADEPFRALRLGDLDVDPAELHRMAMLFGNRLIAAIKPWAFEHFLRNGVESIIYIDSDFMIFESLQAVTDNATEHGVVVVPHVITPVPRDGHLPDETTILGVGTFNAGFFAVGHAGQAFLEFLKERLRRECHTDVRGMRVNEQRWLDFVPALFDHCVLRDPGVDAAPWNIHERRLTKMGDRYLVGNVPLRAFHFSGFDPRIPHVLSARDYWDRPRVPMANEPALAELCANYGLALYAAGYEQHHRIPFSFDYLAEGTPVYASLRRLYTDALFEAEATGRSEPPDPFDAAESAAFRTWAQEAYEVAGEKVPERLARADMSSTTAEDWLGRMVPGEAGQRSPTGVVDIKPNRTGVVLSGPNALADAGHYRATVELWLGDRPAVVTCDTNLIVVEVSLDGYVLGCTSVHQVGGSSVEVDFVIPTRLQQIALSAGVQVRIQCRSEVYGTIHALLVERVSDIASPTDDVVSSEWLPAMSVGDVGERTGSQVIKRSGRAGFMVVGPQWRLEGGHYRAELRLRTNAVQSGDGSTVVALVDVVVHGYVLGFRAVTRDDLATGRTVLDFEVGGRWANHRYTRVELRVRAQGEVDAVLDSVTVQRVGDVGIAEARGESDWLPALWVNDAAVRVGSEIHSIDGEAGILANGPGWRLTPGLYRFDVVVDSLDGEVSDADTATVARIQVLSDGIEVVERLVLSHALNGKKAGEDTHSIEFEVLARQVPPPLCELTPLIELRIITEGQRPIRVGSAILSRKEGPG